MASALGISLRALERWEGRQRRPRRRGGRPEVIPAGAKEKIRACYLARYKVWGPQVLAAWCEREGLGKWSPSTISRVIADLRDERDEPPPVQRYEITRSGVMWSEDGTGFGKGRRKQELLVAQDEHARMKMNWRLVPGPARATHVAEYLEAAFREHGAPLVMKHDGDAIFHAVPVREVLDRWQVVDLTGPSYWPRYNGKKERSMRDIKSSVRALTKHGVGASLAERIDLSMQDLNDERPRPVLGGCTAREVFERDLVEAIDRDEFAEEIRQETRRLRHEARSRHERQAARRHAVEMVLLRRGYLREMGASVN